MYIASRIHCRVRLPDPGLAADGPAHGEIAEIEAAARSVEYRFFIGSSTPRTRGGQGLDTEPSHRAQPPKPEEDVLFSNQEST